MKDSLGDVMKMYEAVPEPRLIPTLPTFARVDGRAFHSFTHGLDRPYDKRMADAMVRTALAMAKETNAMTVYTQSDEITLMWYTPALKSDIWFGGRFSKMVSSAAALATLEFNLACQDLLPEYRHKKPTFDARVWQVPSLDAALDVFAWREWDATKNSITMAAHTVYLDKELHGKDSNVKQAMLLEKGINWNDYPSFFKRGSYIARRTNKRKFEGDLSHLPEKHQARSNPDMVVVRPEYQILDLPPLRRLANARNVLFEAEDPILRTE